MSDKVCMFYTMANAIVEDFNAMSKRPVLIEAGPSQQRQAYLIWYRETFELLKQTIEGGEHLVQLLSNN